METIAYEFRSFEEAYERLSVLIGVGGDSVQERLVLEALLLHARNMRDFLVGTKFEDDVLAVDFLPVVPRFRLPYIRTTWRHLDKLLAHPSFSRPRLKKEWKAGVLYSELKSARDLFLLRLAAKDAIARKWFAEEGF